MFRAFELRLDKSMINEDWFTKYMEIGRNIAISDKTDIKNLLRECITCGCIDGTALTEQFFPTFHRDVFLSYSHNDSDLAYMVAGLLGSYFDLSVFVDSNFWGSADDLLKEIDKEYCYQNDSKTYSYKKRNFSTAHVHTMLTSAILKAIDKSEVVIFINTSNSVPDVARTIRDEGYDYTLSPWIYEEILFTSLIKERNWQTYRTDLRFNESENICGKSLKIGYRLPKEKLISLTIEDIKEWVSKYKKLKKGHGHSSFIMDTVYDGHPLNILYEMKDENGECGVLV